MSDVKNEPSANRQQAWFRTRFEQPAALARPANVKANTPVGAKAARGAELGPTSRTEAYVERRGRDLAGRLQADVQAGVVNRGSREPAPELAGGFVGGGGGGGGSVPAAGGDAPCTDCAGKASAKDNTWLLVLAALALFGGL